jgi:type IV pilus assembly protein PilW
MVALNEMARGFRQAGLSLIELMIAMALGVVLTLGVVQIFLGSSQTYRLTDGLALLQENMRFALGDLQYEGRMAGYYGCLVKEPEILLNPTTGYVYDVASVSAMGWEAGNTGLGDTFTITSLSPSGTAWSNGTGDALPADIDGDIVEGTDVLLINGGKPADVVLTGNPMGSNAAIGTTARTNIPQGAIILAVAGNCTGGDLFQKSNNGNATSISKAGGTGGNPPGNINPSSGFRAGPYDNEARIYEFSSTVFYIGESDNVDPNGDLVPALFRERLDAGDSFGAVELVAGVENMQILYGVTNNPDDPKAERYVTAANVNAWEDVVSVRIALLMRSDDNSVDTALGQTYNLAGTQITTESDRRARLVGVTTAAVRNRLK